MKKKRVEKFESTETININLYQNICFDVKLIKNLHETENHL